MKNDKQIIIGSTIKDIGTKKIIENLEKDKYNYISLGERAFKKL